MWIIDYEHIIIENNSYFKFVVIILDPNAMDYF